VLAFSGSHTVGRVDALYTMQHKKMKLQRGATREGGATIGLGALEGLGLLAKMRHFVAFDVGTISE
jgi:hypothetical protein